MGNRCLNCRGKLITEKTRDKYDLCYCKCCGDFLLKLREKEIILEKEEFSQIRNLFKNYRDPENIKSLISEIEKKRKFPFTVQF